MLRIRAHDLGVGRALRGVVGGAVMIDGYRRAQDTRGDGGGDVVLDISDRAGEGTHFRSRACGLRREVGGCCFFERLACTFCSHRARESQGAEEETKHCEGVKCSFSA